MAAELLGTGLGRLRRLVRTIWSKERADPKATSAILFSSTKAVVTGSLLSVNALLEDLKQDDRTYAEGQQQKL